MISYVLYWLELLYWISVIKSSLIDELSFKARNVVFISKSYYLDYNKLKICYKKFINCSELFQFKNMSSNYCFLDIDSILIYLFHRRLKMGVWLSFYNIGLQSIGNINLQLWWLYQLLKLIVLLKFRQGYINIWICLKLIFLGRLFWVCLNKYY